MKEKSSYVTKVAFVGQPNVGKSTLLNALVGTKIAPTTRKPQTTRRIIRGIKTQGEYQHIYFDTPGVLRKVTGLDKFMHKQIFSAIADVDQIVVIVDAQENILTNKIFLQQIIEAGAKNHKNIILVINKIDTLKDKSKLLNLIKNYSEEFNLDNIIPLSAMEHDGLDVLFDVISKAAEPSPFLFSPDFFTDASEKEIVAELVREKAMLELDEEIPYKLGVTVEHFDESRREDPRKKIIEIEAIIHVERQSQKAIVIGKGGALIRTIGTRARKDIENLLQCQVMLKLLVRVEEDWTNTPKGLRKLGF